MVGVESDSRKVKSSKIAMFTKGEKELNPKFSNAPKTSITPIDSRTNSFAILYSISLFFSRQSYKVLIGLDKEKNSRRSLLLSNKSKSV